MAAGDSIVGICNIGLLELGEPPISSLDENIKAAIHCKARYDQLRREMLRAHPWNFARKYIQLGAASTPPLFQWSNAFPLPNDFIRVHRMPDNPLAKYEVVGGALYCNETAPLNLAYVWDLTDPTKFDPIFVAALGYAVGATLAMPITQSQSQRDRCNNLVEGKLGVARLTGAQESSPEEWDVDVLLQSRS